MNLLTKALLEDLLDTQKTVAIYGGGFKPPTKGHFNVAELVLKQFPEIDELKIFVGQGVRDGITQDESIQIWDIYKKYLSPKVDVEPSVAPVKSVLGYAKENPDTKVYWILGARDGDEGDLADIKNRTKSLDKYPNLEVKVITTSGGVSGTKTRQAVRDNNKEQFFHLIPDVSEEEKQQIWDLVSPVIKEEKITEVGEANLKPYKWKEVDRESYFVYTRFVTDSETQYDVDLKSTNYVDDDLNNLRALGIEFSAKLKGDEGSSAKIVVNKGEMYKVMSTIADIIKTYIKKSKAQAILYSPSKKSDEEDFGTQRDNLYRAFISKAFPGVKFKQDGEIVAAILPNSINELVTDTEVICDNCGWEWPIADGGDDLYICHKCGHDNNPDLEEGRKKKSDPKKGTGKKPEGSSRRLYTDENPKDTVHIKFKTKEDIVDTLNKTSFKAKPHVRQSQVINLIYQRVRAAYSKSKDPEVRSRLKRALDYIEKRKEMSKKKTERLNKMKESSDPFGLNELARQFLKEALIETWNPEESFVSLSRYMIDNGMNIKPLPKIKVIKDDEQNASNLLGKTAYYNPVEKSITLYTMDRHPKDILRSFAHEMVHHEQNLDGRLNNINTTNTNEGGDLPEIEREAYEKGNMMLRNWEDKIKNPLNEYFLDIPKFNYPKTFVDKLRESLHEITLSKNNAAEIEGDLYKGMFRAGNKVYTYDIYRIKSPYNDNKEFYNVEFHPKNNPISTPTGDTTKEDYIKILNTMYKIILDLAETDEPDYIGIASMDNIGDKNYHTIYANLTDNKYNRIPGYFRKDVNLEFNTPQGKGRFVVLKRKDV